MAWVWEEGRKGGISEAHESFWGSKANLCGNCDSIHDITHLSKPTELYKE